MRISRWTLLWILVVGVLVAVEIGVVTGFITPGNIIGSFLTFVFALMLISVLSIVGAVFLGMFVSHRVLSTQGFTPFEQEMLRMRQEIRELTDRVEQIAARLGVVLGDKKKEP
ncbi:MAG TPA: hypothetical protein VEO20_02370 [Thermoplasmata archaeon]|nr:hypothetical protein [Thermoplasmata archaeon]